MEIEPVQTNLRVTSNAQFERFTVQNLPNFSSLHDFDLQSAQVGSVCTVSIATCNSHQSQAGTSCVFEYANDNIHLPINPLGLIVNGLYF